MEKRVSKNKEAEQNTHRWVLRVRDVAQEKGFNEEGLAHASGIPLDQVKNIWEEPTFDASLSTLDAIASALDVGVRELIDDSPTTEQVM